jgi:hypothetical protein
MNVFPSAALRYTMPVNRYRFLVYPKDLQLFGIML